jgi:HK97 family phage major capsid protein
MALTNVTRVRTPTRSSYSVYAGRPTAAFVNEAAAKAATGAEYREITVNIKKIATVVMFTQELLDDAREDPTVLINRTSSARSTT